MPSSATITAYYSFTANTKARASYVNTNFSNYRGHLIAIDPNTATAATTETYDLGSTEYRWRTGYFRDIDIKSNTSTGQALQIIGDTVAGSGSFNFHVGSTLPAQIGYNGFVGNLYGQISKPFGFTSTASYGQMGKISIPDTGLLPATFTTSAYIPDASLTISVIGRPVEVLLKGSVLCGSRTSTSSVVNYFTITLYRSSIACDFVQFGSDGITAGSSSVYTHPIRLIDLSAPVGVNTYRLKYNCGGANNNIQLTGGIMYAFEI